MGKYPELETLNGNYQAAQKKFFQVTAKGSANSASLSAWFYATALPDGSKYDKLTGFPHCIPLEFDTSGKSEPPEGAATVPPLTANSPLGPGISTNPTRYNRWDAAQMSLYAAERNLRKSLY